MSPQRILSPQRTLLLDTSPQRMLLAFSSSQRMFMSPQRMLLPFIIPIRLSPQTMLSPQRRTSPQTTFSPQRMFSPHRIFDAHAYVVRPILVDGVTPVASHQEPIGLPVSIASASAMAPAALISPVPWLKASLFEREIALNSTIAFVRFGVIAFCRWNPFWL